MNDLTGERFGRLVVVGRAATAKGSRSRWVCLCDCGNTTEPLQTNLVRNTRSCGCLRRERVSECRSTHGHSRPGSRTPTYRAWAACINRCNNAADAGYANYGGRGIRVCDRWRNSFEAFLEDMGERPEGVSLDRIDVNGDYEPSNCRWATPKEQANNQRKNLRISAFGETKTAAQWAEDPRCSVSYKCLWARLNTRGWRPERAIAANLHG